MAAALNSCDWLDRARSAESGLGCAGQRKQVRMFSDVEFANYFKVGDIIESGAAIRRENAARLRILAIERDFIRYQSINNKGKNLVRYGYLAIIIEAFPELDPRSMRASVNAALKRAGLPQNYSTENYTYSLAKAYCDRVTQSIFLNPGESPFVDPGKHGEAFEEGRRVPVLMERIERDPKARSACIERQGVICLACHFDFEAAYGPLGRGFIHVHHQRQQLSSTKGKHRVDPLLDLIPLCPNCHAMVHKRDPMLSVGELRVILLKTIA